MKMMAESLTLSVSISALSLRNISALPHASTVVACLICSMYHKYISVYSIHCSQLLIFLRLAKFNLVGRARGGGKLVITTLDSEKIAHEGTADTFSNALSTYLTEPGTQKLQ